MLGLRRKISLFDIFRLSPTLSPLAETDDSMIYLERAKSPQRIALVSSYCSDISFKFRLRSVAIVLRFESLFAIAGECCHQY